MESGTKINTPAAAAGVTCPKDTGEMDPEESCMNCKNFKACFNVVFEALS